MIGFSKLPREERLSRLVEMGVLSADDEERLSTTGGMIDLKYAEHFVENVIGYMAVPMGVAMNFRIDGQDLVIPMAVEETSIIAAASKTAKWVRDCGEITTELLGRNIIGQIQVARVEDFESFQLPILAAKQELLNLANQMATGLVARGGGFRDLTVRSVPRSSEVHADQMAIIHLYADPCDAMGANIMNQVCEGLKPRVEELTGQNVTMCILSNLVDTRLTRATVRIPNIEGDLGQRIEEASLFAEQDPYRAATNNKGVLNGIDAVLLATGNDWRAVEAGVHAFAARSGQYRSITKWTMESGTLVGQLVAPIVVGTVGGVTAIHPTALMNMRMMKIDSSEKLSRIAAAVGLIQNLGALRALTTVGVVQGHMKLHAANLALAAGAQSDEIASVQKSLEDILSAEKKVTLTHAKKILKKLRDEKRTQAMSSQSSSLPSSSPLDTAPDGPLLYPQ